MARRWKKYAKRYWKWAALALAAWAVLIVLLLCTYRYGMDWWMWREHREFLCEVCGLADMSCEEVHDHFYQIWWGDFEPLPVTKALSKDQVVEILGEPNWVIKPQATDEQRAYSARRTDAWPEQYSGRRVVEGSVLVYAHGMMARALIWLSPEGRAERVWVGAT